jgi:hypothetical protein
MAWIISIISVIFAIGALMRVFHGEVEIQPLKVLNPTNFTRPEEIGAVTFRRFWQELNAEKLVIVASSPFLHDYDRVWQGFIAVAKENHVEFDSIFEQEGLRKLSSTSQPLNWEKVQFAEINAKHVLVHVIATDDMWNEVAARTTGGFVIFQSVLPVTANEVEMMTASCHAEDKKKFQLACKAMQTLTEGKRKKFDHSKISAVIEKHGLREHILFIHEAVTESVN